MAILRELRRRARHIVPPVAGACIAGYFLYHMVQGERGVVAWLVLRQQVQNAETLVASTGAERAILERKVRLLRPTSLDGDLLDERARAMLNLAHSDELVIMRAPRPADSRVREIGIAAD